MFWSRDAYAAARRNLACLIAIGALTTFAHAQAAENGAYFARRNTFGILGAYSNDSSHILLGYAENRKLLSFGVSYSRRLILNRAVSWQYDGEILPVALESDPIGEDVDNETSPVVQTETLMVGQMLSCAPQTMPYSFTDPITGIVYSGTTTQYCIGRQWTMGEAMSPLGMQWNFRPLRKIQPVIAGHGGYMFSTRAIPLGEAGSFNFTFDIGAGVEVYRSRTRSIRAEYRYHHISNHDSAQSNPGIDNGLFQLTYCFGR